MIWRCLQIYKAFCAWRRQASSSCSCALSLCLDRTVSNFMAFARRRRKRELSVIPCASFMEFHGKGPFHFIIGKHFHHDHWGPGNSLAYHLPSISLSPSACNLHVIAAWFLWQYGRMAKQINVMPPRMIVLSRGVISRLLVCRLTTHIVVINDGSVPSRWRVAKIYVSAGKNKTDNNGDNVYDLVLAVCWYDTGQQAAAAANLWNRKLISVILFLAWRIARGVLLARYRLTINVCSLCGRRV